jgi:hypothetical protein
MPVDERLRSTSLMNPQNQSLVQPKFALQPQGQQSFVQNVAPQDGVEFVPVDQQFAIPQQDLIQPQQLQVSTTSTPGVPISPEVQRQLQKADEEMQAALAQKEVAITKQGAAEADYNARMVEERNAMAIQQAEKVKEIQQNMQSAKADYDRFKVEAEKSEVDPNRFFDGKVENQVMAALLAGAGAWSAAMTGGQNYAMNVINQAVERDIEQQKIAMNRKDSRATEARRQYEQLANRFGDADNALAMMRLDAIDAMGKKLIATASNENLRANLTELRAQVAEKKAERQQLMYERAAGKNSTTVTQMTGGSTAQDARAKALNTIFGTARNIDSANKVNAGAASNEKLKNSLDRAIASVEKYGTYENLDPEGKAALNTALTTVVQSMQAASNSGVLNPTEFDRFKDEVPINTLGAIITRPSFVIARLKKMKEETDNELSSLVKTNVVEAAKPSYKPKTFKGQ